MFWLNLPQPLGIGHIALTSPTHDKLVFQLIVYVYKAPCSVNSAYIIQSRHEEALS